MSKDDHLEQEKTDEQQKDAGEKSEHKYLSLGLSLGVCLGVALGLTVFDNLAMGMGIGLSLGVAIGAGLDSRNKKEK